MNRFISFLLLISTILTILVGCSSDNKENQSSFKETTEKTQSSFLDSIEGTQASSTGSTTEIPIKKSDVEEAYELAINIDKNDLEVSSIGTYSYKGITISRDIVDKIEFGAKLNQGAIYTSIAKQLKGFYVLGETFYGNWDSDIASLVFGFKKRNSWKKMRTYIDDAMLIISENYPIGEVLSQLNNLSVCEGKFNFKKRKFDFVIKDMTKAACELGITEEMLGFILAWLDEYGMKTKFDGNRCSCSLKYLAKKGISEEDFVYYYNYGDKEVFFDNNEYVVRYFGFDVTGKIVPNDSTDGFSTYRGVQLLHSKNAVILSYGATKNQSFNPVTDWIYENMEQAEHRQILDSCVDYMVYTYKNIGQIVFYFNAKSQVIFVVYIDEIIY